MITTNPSSAGRRQLLIIFMKTPRMGTVKTRLQPDLTPAQSLRLYRAMGKDLVTKFRDPVEFDLQIHYWPDDGTTALREWLGDDPVYAAQVGDHLGQKMSTAFDSAFAQGYDRTVIIGSDLPTLTHDDLNDAFDVLDQHGMVLGPAVDGGYYLVGLTQSVPEVFEGIEWSTGAVLAQTLERSRRCGLDVHLLRESADLDTITEVQALWQHLDSDRRLVEQYAVPGTFATLKEIFGG